MSPKTTKCERNPPQPAIMAEIKTLREKGLRRMEVLPIHLRQRPGESSIAYRTRFSWAKYAYLTWWDRNSLDKMRAIADRDVPDWNKDSEVAYWSGDAVSIGMLQAARTAYVAPWEVLGDRVPDRYAPTSFLVDRTMRTISAPAVAPLGLVLPRPDFVPAWQLRPIVQPRNILTDSGRTLENLGGGLASDLNANLTGVSQIYATDLFRSDLQQVATMTLGMSAGSAYRLLKRGAKMVREKGRYVLKAGSKVLGPIGAIGTTKDVFDFIVWLKDKGAFNSAHSTPTTHYNPSTGLFEYNWGNGTITFEPPRQWNPRLEYPTMF